MIIKYGHWDIKDDTEKFYALCSECGNVEDTRMLPMKCPECNTVMDNGNYDPDKKAEETAEQEKTEEPVQENTVKVKKRRRSYAIKLEQSEKTVAELKGLLDAIYNDKEQLRKCKFCHKYFTVKKGKCDYCPDCRENGNKTPMTVQKKLIHKIQTTLSIRKDKERLAAFNEQNAYYRSKCKGTCKAENPYFDKTLFSYAADIKEAYVMWLISYYEGLRIYKPRSPKQSDDWDEWFR